MATGVGEYLVKQANKRGLVLFVDTDGTLSVYPSSRVTESFRRLLTAHYRDIKFFLITDAVTQE